jgi:hypothetical protein
MGFRPIGALNGRLYDRIRFAGQLHIEQTSILFLKFFRNDLNNKVCCIAILAEGSIGNKILPVSSGGTSKEQAGKGGLGNWIFGKS